MFSYIARSLHINQLKRDFRGKESLTRVDLAKFYQSIEGLISDTTINWRMYELVRLGVLERLGRGRFRLGKMRAFTPPATKHILRLYRNVSTRFPYLRFCIWETSWLNDLAQHYSNKTITIIETEKDGLESVFYELKGADKAVFLEPSEEIMDRYVTPEKNPIVVKAMISEAPIQTAEGLQIPTLEKILVDLICDADVFSAYQGLELTHIWKNAFEKYSVQRDRMLRYANRRKRKQKVIDFISNIGQS